MRLEGVWALSGSDPAQKVLQLWDGVWILVGVLPVIGIATLKVMLSPDRAFRAIGQFCSQARMNSRGMQNRLASWWSRKWQSSREAIEPVLSLLIAFMTYVGTSLIVFVGVWFGVDHVSQHKSHPEREDYVSALSNWDGDWYYRVARDGYSYRPDSRSNVNFFPAFPLLGRLVSRLLGLHEDVALAFVSNLSLCAGFVLFQLYLNKHEKCVEYSTEYTLLAFGLWPTTLFFRMAYSESLFVLLAMLSLHAMRRRWSMAVIICFVGLATACRPVGLALSPVVIWHLWERHGSVWGVVIRAAVFVPLSLWGLIAFVVYLYVAFHDPFVYCKSQEFWAPRHEPWAERLWHSAILEPIWSKYTLEAGVSQARSSSIANPLFSLQWADPVFFLVACLLVVLGWRHQWIDMSETMFAAGVLLISYMSQGHRFSMCSQGRFAAVAFPIYIVLGNILARMPPPFAALCLAIAAVLMALYAALFATWHEIW